MKNHNYFVYITTNPGKSVLYVGVTNEPQTRMEQHKANQGKPVTFTGRYYCYKLLYFERYTYVQHAIEREKEIKLLGREARLQLIKLENPTLIFLNVWE